MKARCLVSLLFLAALSCLSAEEQTAPVMNAVSFEGDYVTFSEAKPKFRPVHQEQPVYPENLLKRRVEGFAIVAFLVELDGTTTQCQVVEASDVAFGEAARAAIALWEFSPPQFGGKPGRIAMSFPVEFTVPAQVAMESSAAPQPGAGS
jgi:TonB family protein